jgi:hypothetical protein
MNLKGKPRGSVTSAYENHEMIVYIGNNSMENASRIPEPMLPGSEFTEVLGCFGYNIIIELEDYAATRLGVDSDIKLSTHIKRLDSSLASEFHERLTKTLALRASHSDSDVWGESEGERRVTLFYQQTLKS